MMTSILPKTEDDWFRKNSIGPMSNANNKFQRALIRGFLNNDIDISLLNVPNIGAFPIRFKKIISPDFEILENDGMKGHNFGFFNFNLLKHYFAYKRILRYLKQNSNDINTLIVYDLYLPFLKTFEKLKHENKNLRIVLVIPDIYGFTGYDKGVLHRWLTKNHEAKINDSLRYVDGFVLLTKPMLQKLPKFIKKKQVIVIEGILDSDFPENDSNNFISKKIILYAGALEKRHGIMNLINAFIEGNFDAELHMYGDGTEKKEILDKIQTVKNIRYLGQQPSEIILQKQREAFLLVNPRTSEGEFTKYSFPSKIMEYFGSGTPTLMYHLEGIPREYYDYCFVPEDESIESLKNKMEEVLNMDIEDLERVGNNAKNFVLENKNNTIQSQKILKLLEVL